MAIDPTTPLTPILPSVPAGTAPDSLVVAQAVARQALANATAELGQIVGRPAAPQTPKTGAPVEQAGQTSTQDAGHAADASGAAKGAPLAQQGPAAKPAPETRTARAVRAAAAEAVPRQAGLAPLMANVRALVDHPDMPPEVREAGRALLTRAPQAAELTTPQGLRQAVERSGVFLEARMARAIEAPVTELSLATTPQANDMKAALLVFRGVLSAWLGRAAPAASAPVAKLANIPGEADEPASDLRPLSPSAVAPAPAMTASARSPIPIPTGAAAFEQVAEAVTVPTPPPEAEAIEAHEESTPKPLPRLQQAPAEDEQTAMRFGGFVAPPKAPPNPIAAARAALSPLLQAGLLAEDAVAEEPAASSLAEAKAVVARGYGAPAADIARSKVPPPPYAGGPMAGQKPLPPALAADQSPADIVRGLLKETGGALARQDLMQIASLPEPQHHGETETAEVRPQGARLNLDLPFVTPQGVAVAQFEISHDGGGSGGAAVGSAERTYKARFSIDIEPLGPVHALVTLTGARARVSLWAERAETIARLRAGEESLGAALRQAELSPEVAVHSGAPPSPGGVSPLGHFVDQAS